MSKKISDSVHAAQFAEPVEETAIEGVVRFRTIALER